MKVVFVVYIDFECFIEQEKDGKEKLVQNVAVYLWF